MHGCCGHVAHVSIAEHAECRANARNGQGGRGGRNQQPANVVQGPVVPLTERQQSLPRGKILLPIE